MDPENVLIDAEHRGKCKLESFEMAKCSEKVKADRCRSCTPSSLVFSLLPRVPSPHFHPGTSGCGPSLQHKEKLQQETTFRWS